MDSAARELLKKLARSEPYYKKQFHMTKISEPSDISDDSKDPSASALGGNITIITSNQLVPPQDKKITSLFIMGIEDDLPEHAIRAYFEKFGPIKSLVCSHRARCAFVNFSNRTAAETAARACRNGDILINGCPLKVQWGKPRPLGGYNQEQQNAKMSRFVINQSQLATQSSGKERGVISEMKKPEDTVLELPPGQDGNITYQSMHPHYQAS